MKKLKIFIFSVLVQLALLETSFAVFIDGNDLYSKCRDDNEAFLYGDCIGYATAIADAMDENYEVDGYKACLPRNVTRGQIVDVIVN